MQRPIVCVFGQVSDQTKKIMEGKPAKIHYFGDDVLLQQLKKELQPEVYITIGNMSSYTNLMKSSYDIRRKWLHYDTDSMMADKFDDQSMHCYITSICETHASNTDKLISIFTSSYKSNKMIYRPLKSLLNQTYVNWEWVILDDTPAKTSDGSTNAESNFANLQIVKSFDPTRIRIYRSDTNSGVIGQVKNTAAHLCRGAVLVELDHDDEILPDTLDLIMRAFNTYPDAGFVYSDFTEVYEDWSNFKYGELFGLGYGAYRKEYHNGRWVNICSTPDINDRTIRHIVGVPNHVRAWRTTTYRELGGHNTHLHVADDYELLVRTFLSTQMVRIPKFCYVQYKNNGGNNFTLIRNAEIQKHVKFISAHYNNKIHSKLTELGIPDRGPTNAHKTYWSNATYDPRSNIVADFFLQPNFVSIILPTYNKPDLLKRAISSVLNQTHQNFELIVIGDKCPVMSDIMETYKDTRIKWWNLESRIEGNEKCGGATAINYALKMVAIGQYVAYLDDDKMWEPNHLSSLVTCFTDSGSSTSPSYAFSSFSIDDTQIRCAEPKNYRINTSGLMHRADLLRKYGYWKLQLDVGYSNDWELISRWVYGAEPYACTGLYTLRCDSRASGLDPETVYGMYDDQTNQTNNQANDLDTIIINTRSDRLENLD